MFDMALFDRLLAKLDQKFVADWRGVIKHAWSIRVAMLWGAVSGLVMVWSAFSDVLPLPVYAAGGVLISVIATIARVTKQPGADE
jgi:hypothetical protein